jgi:hypothetical protein
MTSARPVEDRLQRAERDAGHCNENGAKITIAQFSINVDTRLHHSLFPLNKIASDKASIRKKAVSRTE